MEEYLLLQITPALLPALVLTGMRVNVYFMQARERAGEGSAHSLARYERRVRPTVLASNHIHLPRHVLRGQSRKARNKTANQRPSQSITTGLELTCCPSLPKER
ncbi:hypothetical protein M441DRAFT_423132 [Trichoderma asperellum CBS 433.97]|uniref:Uncharacterized protein n=1 Tax=Trichoderma asperellum (strain ATCC 204424 / CBS 433.97 / NBRC 101777) TaxID=1042311 RepID=A0A2T3Z5A0_TRIA4|nr:hypothetical protein M441DRAFT_423132 [Trichoderma asperellum CBS 433.97]PTB39920.1 hypothetical protein M441DRAFT_423132 [Trichoderma asperellum CBS 433.97]